MSQEEIIEGNKLIYFFMATKLEKMLSTENRFYFENSPCLLHKEANVEFNISTLDNKGNSNLAYHLSFDWLMPVVKKCLNKNEEELDEWKYYYEQIDDSFFQIEISQTWEAVIKFIKWYNTQNQ